MKADPQAEVAEATAVLEAEVGVWDVEIEVFPGPGVPPIQFSAVATQRLVSGRWLVWDHQAATGFEGHGMFGWDPARGKYVGVWVDSTLPSMARLEGDWDASTRIMTTSAELAVDGRTIRYREIVERREDGTRLYRNFAPTPGGSEVERIRAVYRRRPHAQ